MLRPTLCSLSFLLAFAIAPLLAQDHAAVKSAPRDPRWVMRHEGINTKVAEKKDSIQLLMIGDSITDGWAGNGKGAWKHYYEKRNAINLGIGGDQTQHVLWRLENGEIKGVNPKLAVIMIGTNNASNKHTSEQIADGITAIVKKLRTDLPKTKILVLGIFPRGADDKFPLRKVNQGANEIVAKLADNENVYYLDIGAKFLEPDGKISKEIMYDVLHLTPKGYTIWAESMEPMVSKLMGDEAVKPEEKKTEEKKPEEKKAA